MSSGSLRPDPATLPPAGFMARGRGGPEGGTDGFAAVPARGAQILCPLARIRTPHGQISDGAPVVAAAASGGVRVSEVIRD
jgi:hypothetical protein